MYKAICAKNMRLVKNISINFIEKIDSLIAQGLKK